MVTLQKMTTNNRNELYIIKVYKLLQLLVPGFSVKAENKNYLKIPVQMQLGKEKKYIH